MPAIDRSQLGHNDHALYSKQKEVVFALQQRVLDDASSQRAGDMKDLAIALGVSVDKLDNLGAQPADE